MYAIKKIVFNENTDRTRRQAKCALREVRVLASLSHPNIIQYHCAWLELVPCETRTSSSSTTTQKKKPLPRVEQCDSLDQMIEFKRVSSTSQEDDGDESEVKYFSLSYE
jgi:hypothetical protein